MGAKTLLITHSIDTIGQMSCNPAIGGIGKGHLVKEISAMGGIMPLAADQAAIHMRILNASKGPAVQSTRAQADRQLYRCAIKRYLDAQQNLRLYQQPVADLIIKLKHVIGENSLRRGYIRIPGYTDRYFSCRKDTYSKKTLQAGLVSMHQPPYNFLRSCDSITYGRLKREPTRIDSQV